MLNRLSNKAMVKVVAIVGVLLATLLLSSTLWAQSSSIDHPENSKDAVATFSGTDQDGDAIEWSLSGDDKLLFELSDDTGGSTTLSFKSPPNFESKKDAGKDNVYNVTLVATGATHKVAVTVTNVDEDGSVSLSNPQPQVGRNLKASLRDDDGGVSGQEWKWERSEDGATGWETIPRAATDSRTPTLDDLGMYLRATVTYQDLFGAGKVEEKVSKNPVEARTVANAPPSFAGQDEDEDTANDDIVVTRDLNENTSGGVNIGKPVSASDRDNDELVYSIRPDPDPPVSDEQDTPNIQESPTQGSMFSIDGSTGQLKTKTKFNYEADPAVLEFVVNVIARDPSGAMTVQKVTINLKDVNEAPSFSADSDTQTDGTQPPPTELSVVEAAVPTAPDTLQLLKPDGGDSGTELDTLGDGDYVATDPDVDSNDAAVDTVSYSVEGADAKYFSISDAGVLTIDHDQNNDGTNDYAPDFERQSSYSITIVATGKDADIEDTDDRGSLSKRLEVMVTVTNAEDTGTVSLSQLEPQVGSSVVATVKDQDDGVTVSTWQWGRSAVLDGDAQCAENTQYDPIAKATSAVYTPKGGSGENSDVGRCLQATVTYKDDFGADDEDPAPAAATTRKVQISDPGNTAPSFPDQDLATVGDQSDETSREVAENTKAKQPIGALVTADDANGDLRLYTLSGTDADSFGISRTTGQLMTKAKLDYETKNMYTVVVTATDPSGASDSILVTINVTDEDDKAVISGLASKDHAENSKDAVATFSGTDQDGDAIEWSLSGDDKLLFELSDDTGGSTTLSFKSPPNFESKKDAGKDNVYNVTLVATGATHKVAVTVTNVDEDGSVSLSNPQPQVGRNLKASLRDDDGGVSGQEWKWERSEDGATGWETIPRAATDSRTPTLDDLGMYLRATVTYQDLFGAGKVEEKVSKNPVEARTVANAPPSFAGQDEDEDTANDDIVVTRDLNENTSGGVNIGKPVSASDRDNDELVYSIRPDPDPPVSDEQDTPNIQESPTQGSMFSIDGSTGQLKTKTKFNYEADPAVLEFVVNVIARDPSGAMTVQKVTINLKDVNEAPSFSADSDTQTDGTQPPPTELSVVEAAVPTAPDTLQLLKPDGGDSGTELDTLGDGDYVATDPDVDSNDAAVDTVSYSVEGADAKYFSISDAGVLTIDHDQNNDGTNDYAPDFERQSSYSITIVATGKDADIEDTDDRGSLSKRLEVMVTVTNAEDTGTVSLSQLEPQVGSSVVATVKDQDDGVTVSTWQWGRSAVLDGDAQCAENTQYDPIAKATSAVYTPKGGSGENSDVGRCLQATVTYKDDFGADDEDPAPAAATTRKVQISDPGNTAPSFPDQDLATVGDQSDETSREVAENTKAKQPIGALVTADDANGDLRLYTLSGTDADSFGISRTTGQLMTKAKLDYETKNMYTVVVTATDPSGASDSILVTINVTDENDGATITLNSAPAFDADTAERSVEENAEAGGAVGDPVAATDPNAGQTLTYTLGGDDAGSFTIDGTGQIMVGEGTTLDYETKSSYTVMVTATDPAGESDSVTVTISVTDMNEAPAFDADMAERSVEENTAAGEALGDPIAAMDMDADDTLTYTLGGDDAESFAIDGETGQLTTMAALDYETKNSYTVMVTATDSGEASDSIMVTITVTDVNEAPAFDADMAERSVAENTAAGEALGDPIAAMDVDADDTLTYTLSGDDAESFAIDGETGQLTTMAALDYETKNSYTVMVTATDSGEASDSIMVTITVTDVNEAPVVMGDAEVSYEEGGMDAVGTYTVEPAEATLSLGGDDADAFTLTDGVLSFNETPDYEAPGDADMDNVYMVTITGTMGDQMGEQAIAITVTNMDEMGSISFDTEEPRAGTAVTASLMDYDGVVEGSVTWQWSIESEPGTYEDIEGATSDTYTPVVGDEEKHIRVTAMYDDGEGMGKTAVATVINLVSAEVDYDADGDGTISRDEAVTAVQDYFDNVITREQVLGVIMDYFAGVGQ